MNFLNYLIIVLTLVLGFTSCSKESINQREEEIHLNANAKKSIKTFSEDEDILELANIYSNVLEKLSLSNQFTNDETLLRVQNLLEKPLNINANNFSSITDFFGYKDKNEFLVFYNHAIRVKKKIINKYPELKNSSEKEIQAFFSKKYSDLQYGAFINYDLECSFDPLKELVKGDEQNPFIFEVCPDWYDECKGKFESCVVRKINTAEDDYFECEVAGFGIFAGSVGVGAAIGGVGVTVGAVFGFFGGSLATLTCMSNIKERFYDGDCPECKEIVIDCCT